MMIIGRGAKKTRLDPKEERERERDALFSLSSTRKTTLVDTTANNNNVVRLSVAVHETRLWRIFGVSPNNNAVVVVVVQILFVRRASKWRTPRGRGGRGRLFCSRREGRGGIDDGGKKEPSRESDVVLDWSARNGWTVYIRVRDDVRTKRERFGTMADDEESLNELLAPFSTFLYIYSHNTIERLRETLRVLHRNDL